MKKLSACATLFGVTICAPAYAWGPQGHETIATVARDILAERNPKAASEIYTIIREDNLLTVYTPKKSAKNPLPKARQCSVRTIAQLANWPDCVRNSDRYAYSSSFHYDDVARCPPGGALPPKSTYCSKGKCGSAALAGFVAVLKDKTAPSRKRSEALSFVVHIVGDLHQPMHAVDNGNDQGGNGVSIGIQPGAFQRGNGNAAKLHSLWDGDLVEEAVGLNIKAGITKVRQLADGGASDWASLDPDGWVLESHLKAENAYAKLTKPPVCEAGAVDGGKVTASYVSENAAVVEARLAAAVRLAAVLEDALSGQ